MQTECINKKEIGLTISPLPQPHRFNWHPSPFWLPHLLESKKSNSSCQIIFHPSYAFNLLFARSDGRFTSCSCVLELPRGIIESESDERSAMLRPALAFLLTRSTINRMVNGFENISIASNVSKAAYKRWMLKINRPGFPALIALAGVGCRMPAQIRYLRNK